MATMPHPTSSMIRPMYPLLVRPCMDRAASNGLHPAFLPPGPSGYPCFMGMRPQMTSQKTPKNSFTIEAILGENPSPSDSEDIHRRDGGGMAHRDSLHLQPFHVTPGPRPLRYNRAQPSSVTRGLTEKRSMTFNPSTWKQSKSKRVRTIFTPEQLERLEVEFERQQYMVGTERYYLAAALSLTEAQVKVWFQNRRIKWRKQNLEQQHAKLASLQDTLYSGDECPESDRENDLNEISDAENFSFAGHHETPQVAVDLSFGKLGQMTSEDDSDDVMVDNKENESRST